MTDDMKKALVELRAVIVKEHPSTVEATITFMQGDKVEVDIQEKEFMNHEC